MYQEEDNKKISPVILVITGVVALVLIIIFSVQVINEKKKRDANIDNLDISIVDNGEEWSKCRKVSVNNYETAIKEYSFDDGVTWTDSNIYETCEAGVLNIKVRNSKGKEIGSGSIQVTGIDAIKPTIILSDLTVKVNDTVNLLDGVSAVDNESGIAGEITYTPTRIDTSKKGEYTVTYKVFDQAGNLSVRERIITVED